MTTRFTRRLLVLTATLGLTLASRDAAALSVFACEPEWAALASELGGDKVEVFAATKGLQDPHQIQARPALIARLRNAELAICTGAELEIGWLPVLQRSAGNGAVQPGQRGFIAAAEQIGLKEQPTRLDRADGDVHPAGNPHIQTDPRNIARVAAVVTQRLIDLDARNAEHYRARAADFDQRWRAAIARWETQAAPLKGLPVAVEHRSWIYLLDWLGLREVGAIEPKPGIPPSSGYLAQLVAELPRKGARMILYAAYEDPRSAQSVAQRIGIPAVLLPFTVGGSDAAKDLFGLFDDTVARLLAAANAGRS
jgi:zinc/manganese transport system substrate-binding protein